MRRAAEEKDTGADFFFPRSPFKVRSNTPKVRVREKKFLRKYFFVPIFGCDRCRISFSPITALSALKGMILKNIFLRLSKASSYFKKCIYFLKKTVHVLDIATNKILFDWRDHMITKLHTRKKRFITLRYSTLGKSLTNHTPTNAEIMSVISG